MRLTTLCLLLALGPGAAYAQPADTATLQTLIQEVRQLRLAIERSSTLVPRLQLTLARYQAQQDRVERLEREMRTFHTQITTESTGKDHMTATIARMEEQARQTQDAALRKQYEDSSSAMRRELEMQAQREQQWRLQEADLAGQLKTEQAKLNELSNQLDQLDRKMQTSDK